MLDQQRIRAVRDALEPLAPRGVVIVPAYDEARLLPTFLESVAAQQPVSDIVLLVHANNCRDTTAEVARSHAERLGSLGPAVVESRYDPPNVGLVRAESAEGALLAGAQWLLFLDADGTLPDVDFLAHADATAAAGADRCWGGASDEFADVRRLMRAASDQVQEPELCDALLACGSDFRCRALPRALPVTRYTDGSNCMVLADAYAAIGGFEPKRFGGDSTLGDRYLAHTGSPPGFFDRPVVTSCRKLLAAGQLGGFVFYPVQGESLPTVRSGVAPGGLGAVTPGRCLDSLCDDLRAFLLFTEVKRRPFLSANGVGPVELAREVAEAFDVYRSASGAPLRIDAQGDELTLSLAEGARARRFSLREDVADQFWRTGE